MKRILRAKRVLLLVLLGFIVFVRPVRADEEVDLEREIAMGAQVSADIEEHFERIEDPVILARLSMILNRLTPFTERAFPYEVRVIREDEPNAFSLPGGIVYMTSGMIPFCRSDAEIAAVLAHELVHADRAHVLQQVARNRKLTLVALAVAIATKGQAGALLAGNLAQVAIMNSYSRDLEEEADRLGLTMLYEGGYAPAAMVTLLERLYEERMKRPWRDPGIYQDHPEADDRVHYVIGQIREARWPLNRKEPLHLLKVTLLDEPSGRAGLAVDGKELLSVSRGDANRGRLAELGETLRQQLQLEMMPGDIQVLPDGTGLRVGNARFLLETLKGLKPSDPEEVRQRLVTFLLEAKSEHPVAEYMR